MTTPTISTTKTITNRDARSAIGGASSFLTQAGGLLDTIGHDADADRIRRELHTLYVDLAERGEALDKERAPLDDTAGAEWDDAPYKAPSIVPDAERLPPFPHLERQRLDAMQENTAGSIIAGKGREVTDPNDR